MEHRRLDSLGELRQALETKRERLVRDHLRLVEFAAERDPDLRDSVVELMERNGLLLCQVLNALDRIADSRYGQCLNCGEPVCEKHLAALPWATLCHQCQEPLDTLNAHARPAVFHAG
jgi:RNA polymerase-binding transcription factor DksA